MSQYDNLCPNCFGVKGTQANCTHCGYVEQEQESLLTLPYRTVLDNGGG